MSLQRKECEQSVTLFKNWVSHIQLSERSVVKVTIYTYDHSHHRVGMDYGDYIEVTVRFGEKTAQAQLRGRNHPNRGGFSQGCMYVPNGHELGFGDDKFSLDDFEELEDEYVYKYHEIYSRRRE